MGGFISKDTMDKIDDYIVIPEECEGIEPVVESKVNDSMKIITAKLQQKYSPTLLDLKKELTEYSRVLGYGGIAYIILFVIMLVVQITIVIMLMRR